jgi:hypothetical protein
MLTRGGWRVLSLSLSLSPPGFYNVNSNTPISLTYLLWPRIPHHLQRIATLIFANSVQPNQGTSMITYTRTHYRGHGPSSPQSLTKQLYVELSMRYRILQYLAYSEIPIRNFWISLVAAAQRTYKHLR